MIKNIFQYNEFRACASCSKIVNVKSIFNTVKIFRASSVFQGKRKVAQKSWMLKIYSIQWKLSGKTVFEGMCKAAQKSWLVKIYPIQWKISRQGQSCSKILNVKKCIQYSETFQGKLCCWGQAQVVQNSWTVKKIQCSVFSVYSLGSDPCNLG